MGKFDFSGWATKNDLKCSDGRTILKDAFKHDDGRTVPLVWNHQHNDVLNVLGHAKLENRNEGVYAYGVFNKSEAGQAAKRLVEAGDVTALSVYANNLQHQNGGEVVRGSIREVSLVIAGANPGAFIDSIIRHDDGTDEEAVIYTGELLHTEEEKEEKEETLEHVDSKKEEPEENDEETVGDVFSTLTEKQKDVVYHMVATALEEGEKLEEKKEEGDQKNMKHNIFDEATDNKEDVLSHADTKAIFEDAKRYGTIKESVMQHGITDIEYLFPDAKTITPAPLFVQRDMGWVQTVMSGVRRSPFSRIKSLFADLTEDDARAKGYYTKGKEKKEQVFALLKRTTSPTTVYKKQRIDRDDMIDIVDFDVVSLIKAEMRQMLDEELARAFLIGDGRLASSDDKINEQNIRPIYTDDEFYTIKKVVPAGADPAEKAKTFIKTAVRSRKEYKGSGNPILFTTEDMLTELLLLEDTTGRVIYESEDKLARALRVSSIVTVPVMDNVTRTEGEDTYQLEGIIVNPKDYAVGADKGGAVNMFDDFDIDYNAMKYLIETRCSGALIMPYSAIVLESSATAGG